MKNRTMMKRCISMFICICMCFSLIPGLIASAKVGYPTTAEPADLDTVLTSGGHVLKYSTFIEDDVSYVKIEVGAYKATKAQTYVLKLLYNPDIVTPVIYNAENKQRNGVEVVASNPTGNQMTLQDYFSNQYFSPVSKQSSTVTNNTYLQNTRWNLQTTDGNLNTLNPPFQFATGTGIGTTTVEGDTYGTVSVEMLTQEDTSMRALLSAGNYVDSFIDQNQPVNVTFAQDGFVSLYSLYFKKTTGRTIDNKTITIWSNDANKEAPTGSAFKSGETFISQDAAFVSFPGEDTAYDTRIRTVETDRTSGIGPGAEVVLYLSSDDSYVGTYTSNANGYLNESGSSTGYVSLKAGTYKYVATANNHLETTGTLQVTGDGNVILIEMPLASSAKYDVPVTVTDADTGLPITGATVTLAGSTYPDLTDSDGKATDQSSAGTFSLSVSCNGYQPLTNGSVSIIASADYKTATISGNDVSLVPVRAEVAINTPKDKNTLNPIPLSAVSVTKISGPTTTEWTTGTSNTNSVSHTYSQTDIDAGSYSFTLPKGTSEGLMVYRLFASATGYESSDSYYMTIDSLGNKRYYTDNELKDEITYIDFLLEPYSEPLYTVIVNQPESVFDEYTSTFHDQVTVDVYLKNINAFYGTFGLKWDSSLFNGYTYELVGEDANGTKMEPFLPWTEMGVSTPPITINNPSSGDGYHIVTWQGEKDDQGTPFETLGDNVKIATYKFTAKDDKELLDEINKSTFSVMEYDKTSDGLNLISYYGSYNEAYNFMKCYWRYCDNANGTTSDPAESLVDGRLHHTMAINDGFYQAYAKEVYNGTENITVSGNKFYDVKTDIQYDFPIKSIARLQFNVRNEKSVFVDDATIYIYKASDFTTVNGKSTLHDGALPVKTLTTDALGEAYWLVEAAEETTYGYRVEKTGYWDYPIDTVGSKAFGDLKTVSLLNDRTNSENIELKSKTYHEVVLGLTGDGSLPTVSSVATNLGVRIAYNGNDYIFNIQSKPGYTFTHPNELTFTIAGVDDNSLRATFSPAKNAYVIDGADVQGLSDALTPDSDGYKAGDLTILLNYGTDVIPSPDDEQYSVIGTAGSHGTVQYAEDSDADYVAATTGTITKTGFHSGDSSKTFTFDADDGYAIDKVYINGSVTTAYQGRKTMTYMFTDINYDRNITVTFGKDGASSEDTLLTVVVSDRGHVNLTAPNAMNGQTINANTTRTFIIEGALAGGTTVNFSAPADSGYAKDRYIFNGVETYSQSVVAVYGQNNVLMVSFKLIGEPSFAVFVNAHIVSGIGTVTPCGLTSYSLGTAPVYDMVPYGDLVMGGYTIDGVTTNLGGNLKQYTLQMDPLTADTDLGVIFSEIGYKVTGRVDLKEGGATGSMDDPNTGATVSFVRSDGYVAPPITTTAARVAEFETELPVGNWTVTVSKNGYINYVITDFTVVVKSGTAANEICPGALAMTPLIGDASHDKKYITLEDVGLIANGLMTGVSTASTSRANVNDDLVTDINDIHFAKKNYAAKETIKTWNDFKNGV